MGLKELILQKGWAGRTIDRTETIERINPIIRTMNELMQLHGALSAARTRQTTTTTTTASGVSARLQSGANLDKKSLAEGHLRTLRMDIGKMCEIVFSSGGVAYNGTDLNPEDYRKSDGLNFAIRAKEAELEIALSDESNIEHQMHSRAILAMVSSNQKERLKASRRMHAPSHD